MLLVGSEAVGPRQLRVQKLAFPPVLTRRTLRHVVNVAFQVRLEAGATAGIGTGRTGRLHPHGLVEIITANITAHLGKVPPDWETKIGSIFWYPFYELPVGDRTTVDNPWVAQATKASKDVLSRGGRSASATTKEPVALTWYGVPSGSKMT